MNTTLAQALKNTKQLILQAATNTKPTIIVGLSGGPDSVFLLHMLVTYREQLPITLVAAHLNHGWRASAVNDTQLCADLCKQLNVTLISKRAQDLDFTPPHNGSQEAAGRALRQHFFAQLLQDYPGSLIALGHHAQDQEETFFIRLARGASLQGLCGMRALTPPYIRPLLALNKSDIVEYLADQNITYAIDETNDSMDFLRNRIRHNLVPALHECDARFGSKIIDTMRQLQAADDYMTFACEKAYAELINATTQHASLSYFKSLHSYLQKRVLLQILIAHDATFSPSDGFLVEIIRFLHTTQGGMHRLSSSWHIHKKQQSFWICSAQCF